MSAKPTNRPSKYQVFLLWSNDTKSQCRDVRKFFKEFNKKTAKPEFGITFEIIDHCFDTDDKGHPGAVPAEELLARSKDTLALTIGLCTDEETSLNPYTVDKAQHQLDLVVESAEQNKFHQAIWFVLSQKDVDREVLSGEVHDLLRLPEGLKPDSLCLFGEDDKFSDLLAEKLTEILSSDDRPWIEDENAAVHAIEAARRQKMEKLIEMGIDPFGHRFDNQQAIADVRALEGEITEETTTEKGREQKTYSGPKVRVAGRIVLMRPTGKLIFINLIDRTGTIQLFLGQAQVGERNWEIAQCLDLGDIIGVDGELKKTKTGELTIFVEELHFLTKTLEAPPEKHKGITDPELRQRMRYVDLAYGEGVLDRFVQRTQIVRSIRDTLVGEGYYEIEGPTLHTIAGGAAARPFETFHNALGMPLVMRIALELHLKRLLVGGMERVFELGRVYRNEGISPRHNPEFTMLEVYQAFGNYETMMELTQNIIVNALDAIGSGYKVPFGDKEIDFTPPFERRAYRDLLAEHAGIDPANDDEVIACAKKLKLDTEGKHPDVLRNEIFEETVEDKLVGPIFVIDYPASICPLTKRKKDQPEIAERFELFIHGMELANAYTELNDPDLQEKLFRTQLEGMAEEDSMARMDTDFVRALRNGMPPAGGLGIGIDRLVMLLTNSSTIREVILFPLLRHEAT
ncbi:lysine--tRNA ligase [Blastopirellula marina]|uniref:Lysine--tRNA ligase n=1 Tax=Blastopirellula marina TaxID=124 RepID=A0A2S8GKE6_9BACT|nr:lysine--tRNA ligase [Blastopirellula marina]